MRFKVFLERIMKKFDIVLIVSCFLFAHCGIGKHMRLPPAPSTIDQFNEIAVTYDQDIAVLFNALKPEERVFMYYFGEQVYQGIALLLIRCIGIR
jgi:hypothetical protein